MKRIRGDKHKHDEGKAAWDLLPIREVEEIVWVLTKGSKKYGANDWQTGVPDFTERYYAAAMRHIVAWRKGEKYDQESGRHHLGHAACCLLFLLWKELTDDE